MRSSFWLLFLWVASAKSNVGDVRYETGIFGSTASGNTNLTEIRNQPETFKTLCPQSLITSASQFRLPVTNGEITVYCLWSAQEIDQIISTVFRTNGHLTTSAEVVGATNKSLSYLQRDLFVSICILNCVRGEPYHRFNYLTHNLDEPDQLNVGCDDVDNMKCKETCPSFPSTVNNGMVACSEGTFHGSICYLRCNAGFISRGTAEKKCNASLSAWFPDAPYICDATCPLVALTVENGQVHCTDSTFLGSVCMLQCDEGYEPRGRTEKRCLSVQKRWSFEEPFQCVAVAKPITCAVLMPPENGKVECTHDNSLFSKCTTTCDVGFNPRKAVEYWCFPDQTSEKSSWYFLQGSSLPQRFVPTQITNCKEIEPPNRVSPSQTATLENSAPFLQPKRLGSCLVSPNVRRPCGNIDTAALECRRRSCCWDRSHSRRFQCFQPYKRPRRISPSSSRTTGNSLPPQNSYVPARFVPAVFALEEFETYIAVSRPYEVPGSGATGRQNNKLSCGCKEETFPTTRLCSNLNLNLQMLHSIRRRPVTRISHSLCGDASTTAAHWPWHAVVYFNKELCGGTLVAPQYVITAAHCLFPNDGSLDNVTPNKYVGLGTTNISNNADPHLQIRTIQTIVRHPNYTNAAGYARNDIAILKLNRPVDVNGTYVRPLCLPNNYVPRSSDECFAAGFGQNSKLRLTPTTILQAVRLPLVSRNLCQRYYIGYPIDYLYICAGGTTDGDSDTCQGDSGGALACRRAGVSGDCHWYLAGITSFGRTPCGRGIPGVYTNVYHYQAWIRETVFRLSQS